MATRREFLTTATAAVASLATSPTIALANNLDAESTPPIENPNKFSLNVRAYDDMGWYVDTPCSFVCDPSKIDPYSFEEVVVPTFNGTPVPCLTFSYGDAIEGYPKGNIYLIDAGNKDEINKLKKAIGLPTSQPA